MLDNQLLAVSGSLLGVELSPLLGVASDSVALDRCDLISVKADLGLIGSRAEFGALGVLQQQTLITHFHLLLRTASYRGVECSLGELT